VEYLDTKTLSKKTSLSVFTLRKFAKMGMPHVRVGRKILVKTDDFEEWFENKHRVSSGVRMCKIDQILSEALSDLGLDSS
jgi:excisionase family DNA binding protein